MLAPMPPAGRRPPPGPPPGLRRRPVARRARPLARGVASVGHALGRWPAELAGTAGEDYELCVCIPPSARRIAAAAVASRGLTYIGQVVERPAGLTFTGTAEQLSGYEH